MWSFCYSLWRCTLLINGHNTDIYKKQLVKVSTTWSDCPSPPDLPVQDILRDRPVWINCSYSYIVHSSLWLIKLAMEKDISFILILFVIKEKAKLLGLCLIIGATGNDWLHTCKQLQTVCTGTAVLWAKLTFQHLLICIEYKVLLGLMGLSFYLQVFEYQPRRTEILLPWWQGTQVRIYNQFRIKPGQLGHLQEMSWATCFCF